MQESTIRQAQRTRALQRANEVRMARSAIKESLYGAPSSRESLRQLAQLIQGENPIVQGMTFASLVGSCYRIGTHRMRQVLRQTGTSATVKVRDLTPRQRYRIFVVLNER